MCRNGQLFLDQINDRDRAKVALPEIEHHVIAKHVEEPRDRRFVKAEFLFQFFDKFGWQTT